MATYVRKFEEIGLGDLALVGGKNASLGELMRAGVKVPRGFAVTAPAYWRVIETAGGWSASTASGASTACSRATWERGGSPASGS